MRNKIGTPFLIYLTILIFSNGVFSQNQINLEKRSRGNFNSSGHTLNDKINIKDCMDNEEWKIEYSMNSSLRGDLKFYIGENCDSSQYRSDTKLCREIVELADTSPETHSTFNITVSQIVGSKSCESTQSGTYTLWAILFTSGGSSDGDILAKGSISFTVDFTPPLPPKNVTAKAGENKVTISWNYPGDITEIKGYRLLCVESQCEDNQLQFKEGDNYFDNEEYLCKEVSGNTTDNATIYGLENGVEYAFSVVAIDDAQNPSNLSPVVCATPVEVEDFWEHYKNSGGSEDGGFCFIATTVYGDYNAPQVKVLRIVRDNFLKKLPLLGNLIVSYYYTHGRSWAQYIERLLFLKKIARFTLNIVVGIVIFLFFLKNHIYQLVVAFVCLNFLLLIIFMIKKRDNLS